jgi:hypothetical protein
MKDCCFLKWRSLLFIILGIIAIFSGVSSLSIFVNADNLNPGVYSKDSKPFGISYGDWIARHTNWIIQIPSAVNPIIHYTSDRCATAQSGPVWFLTNNLGGTETRNCTIPAGKAILIPTSVGFCSDDGTDPSQSTEEGLTNCAMQGNQGVVVSATLDGRIIQHLESYRTQSPFFNITVPNDNVFNNKAGVWKAKTDGFFIFLEPLPHGMHTLHITLSVINTRQSTYDLASDLTYNLIVKS